MTPREKKLLAVVALIGLLWGANVLRGKYVAWYDSAAAEQSDATDALRRAELELRRAKYAQRMLREWQDRSLPTTPQRAQAEYRDWLIQGLKKADLQFEYVKPTGIMRIPSNEIDPLPISFAIQTEGKLEDLLEFLDSFYRSDQLHKITKLTLTPKAGDRVTATIDVEGLVVQGAKRESGLAEGKSDRLAHDSARDYIKGITSRKLFSEYKPAPPPRPPRVVEEQRPRTRSTPPKFDDSERAYFNAAVQGKTEGELRAWVNVRTTGESLQLSAGDKFEIGELKGQVASVSLKQLVIETNEGTLAIKLGDSLRSGKKLRSSSRDAGG
jgi:hypothetical protein